MKLGFRVLQNVEKVHSRAQLLTPVVKQYPPYFEKWVKKTLQYLVWG